MRLKFIACLAISLLLPSYAFSQSGASIGFMSTRSAKDSTRVVAAFVQGLREAGFEEGKNVSIQYRFAEGSLDRLPAIADELVRSGVGLIAAVGATGLLAGAAVAMATMPGR